MSNIKYREIADGVRVLCVNTDKFKTNVINVDFYVPIGEYLAEQYVLSSLLGHTSGNYPTFKSFNSKVESLYGADFTSTVSNYGDNVKITFTLELPDDRFAFYGESVSKQGVEFLTDIILNPICDGASFDENAARREIRFTLEDLEAKKNNKRAYAVSRLKTLMCAGEKYGVDSEKLESDVANITAQTLYTAYKSFMKTAQIVVTACGTIDENMLCDEFCKLASALGERDIAALSNEFVTNVKEVRYFSENMKMMNQAKLVMGLRSGMKNEQDDYYAYKIMTDVFGGGPYSRLFTNVREKMSLCYYCGARLVRQKGIIFVQSGIEKENGEKAVNEILNQLDIMKKGEFTDGELESSKKALADAYCGVEDSPNGVCTFFASQCFAEEIVTGEEEAKALMNITREDVISCAKRVTLDSVYLLSGEESDDE